MRDIDLFQLALGLVPPWMVSDAKFDADKKRLDIEIDFKTGGRFACPECGKADCPVHDTVKKSWRHLNFFQHEAFLHARVARIDCPEHGVRLVDVPWARPGSGFTLLFEAFVMTLVKDMPVAAVARLVGEHDTRLWRVIQHYVDTAVARMDLSELRRVAIDETAAKRGQDYISLFVDIDARKVVYVTEGNDAQTVARFTDHVDDHNSDASRIKQVCIDMSCRSPNYAERIGSVALLSQYCSASCEHLMRSIRHSLPLTMPRGKRAGDHSAGNAFSCPGCTA
jgi:transposase